MTLSKKIRKFLQTRPNATARDVINKYACSPATAYRLVKEAKSRYPDFLKLAKDLKMAKEIMPVPEAPKIDIEQFRLTDEKLKKLFAQDTANTIDNVNHPAHYKVGGIETIDFIEAKGLHHHYHLANAIKYISRAPYKNDYTEDLKKAVWYLQREINRTELACQDPTQELQLSCEDISIETHDA